MLKDLIKLANALDSKGLRAEADFLDEIINKSANRKEDVVEKSFGKYRMAEGENQEHQIA